MESPDKSAKTRRSGCRQPLISSLNWMIIEGTFTCVVVEIPFMPCVAWHVVFRVNVAIHPGTCVAFSMVGRTCQILSHGRLSYHYHVISFDYFFISEGSERYTAICYIPYRPYPITLGTMHSISMNFPLSKNVNSTWWLMVWFNADWLMRIILVQSVSGTLQVI